MEQGQQIIRLTLDAKEPVELKDFVSSFTAIAAEYDRFMRLTYPDIAPDATLYVKEVRKGSIEADLVPLIFGTAGVGGFIGVLGHINTVTDFVERYGKRISTYLKPGGRVAEATKSELKHFSEQVASIANNPNSTIKFAAVEHINGNQTTKAVFEFNAREAQEIQYRVFEHKLELDHIEQSDHERVSMRFTRSDTSDADPGKRSGEKVIIESISLKTRPLIYASKLAEQAIKHEIREGDENIYKKIFVVDVNVDIQNGKPFAYRVTQLHQVEMMDDD